MKHFITTLVAFFTVSATAFGYDYREKQVDLRPSFNSFELSRYLGLWYEIARFENSFQRSMTNVTANYSIKNDGSLKVFNSGYLNGELKTIEGKAKKAKSKETLGYLRVSFFLSFYSDYRVIELAPDYSWAVVASGAKYLWILSRTSTIDQNTLSDIVNRVEKRGFEVKKLIYNKK